MTITELTNCLRSRPFYGPRTKYALTYEFIRRTIAANVNVLHFTNDEINKAVRELIKPKKPVLKTRI